jgi:hypothetical protein
MSDLPQHSPHEMSDGSDRTQVMSTDFSDDFEDDPQSYNEFGDLAGRGSDPPRPRRVLVNRWTVLLAAIVLGGACFYGGVRVEKSQVGTGSARATSGFAGLASRFTAAGGTAGSATGARAGATGGRTGGFAGGFGGAATGGAGGGTTGTIATIDGDTLDVTETGGNTVKVDLSDTTTLQKTSTVARSKLFPGDTVSISGSTGSNGTIKATSVTDSGTGSSTSSTGSTGANSTSSSGSSALNSLFGG